MCKDCKVETIRGYFKLEQGFLCFLEENNENEKIKNLQLPLVYGLKCPKCKKIEFYKNEVS